jgi:hypothetical protein
MPTHPAWTFDAHTRSAAKRHARQAFSTVSSSRASPLLLYQSKDSVRRPTSVLAGICAKSSPGAA